MPPLLRCRTRLPATIFCCCCLPASAAKEAAGLRWGDIDLAARLIRLPAAKMKSGRKLDLPMSDFVRDLLVARRAGGRMNRLSSRPIVRAGILPILDILLV